VVSSTPWSGGEVDGCPTATRSFWAWLDLQANSLIRDPQT